MPRTLLKAHLVLPRSLAPRSGAKRALDAQDITIAHDSYLEVTDGVVTRAGPVPFGEWGDIVDLTGHYIVPGLVDLQVNGGGGMLFNDAASVADLHAIIRAHLAHGTTGLLATLLTDAPEALEKQLAFIADAIATDALCRRHILGIHLEGPFFNPDRRGTHPLQFLMLPERAWVERWIAAARGQLKIVTLAPELPGALDVIRLLRERGVLVAMAHSEATYEDACAAIDAGATLGTHLFNTMSQLQGRAPGLVGALLDRDVDVGLINDGHHVSDACLRIALRAKTLQKSFFVSDAMHALGAGTHMIDYRGETLHMENGAIINARGKFAGSAAPLLTAFQRAVSHLGLSVTDAVRLCSMNPAAIIGATRGLEKGALVDAIVLGPDFSFLRVL